MLAHTTCCYHCLLGRRTLLRNLLSCSLLSMYTSFVPLSALRQVHSLYQSQFSTQCDLVLPLSVYSIISFSLRSSTSCLRLPPRLPYVLSFPLSFSNVFFTQHVTNQLAFLLLICMLFISFSLTPNTSSFLTQSVQLISSATFQNVQVISDPLSELSKFQHHTKLRSKCSTLLVSPLNLRPIC